MKTGVIDVDGGLRGICSVGGSDYYAVRDSFKGSIPKFILHPFEGLHKLWDTSD